MKSHLPARTGIVSFPLSVQDASGPRRGLRPPEQGLNTAR